MAAVTASALAPIASPATLPRMRVFMDLSALSLEVPSKAGDAAPNLMVAARQVTNKAILTTKGIPVNPWATSGVPAIV